MYDRQGNRLSWIKVTGGELTAKMMLPEASGAEKVDQVRVYSGAKFTTVESVPAGPVCAGTGPARTFPGDGLGTARHAAQPAVRPVLTYPLLPGSTDVHACLQALRELEDRRCASSKMRSRSCTGCGRSGCRRRMCSSGAPCSWRLSNR